MPDHSDGCVPRTVRSRSFKGGRQGVGLVACGDAWHVPGRIDSSMATAKTYQSPPMCLRKCACQYVLASVVQHRHVAVFEGEVAAVVLLDVVPHAEAVADEPQALGGHAFAGQ